MRRLPFWVCGPTTFRRTRVALFDLNRLESPGLRIDFQLSRSHMPYMQTRPAGYWFLIDIPLVGGI
jgi:hypothetical protein